MKNCKFINFLFLCFNIRLLAYFEAEEKLDIK